MPAAAPTAPGHCITSPETAPARGSPGRPAGVAPEVLDPAVGGGERVERISRHDQVEHRPADRCRCGERGQPRQLPAAEGGPPPQPDAAALGVPLEREIGGGRRRRRARPPGAGGRPRRAAPAPASRRADGGSRPPAPQARGRCRGGRRRRAARCLRNRRPREHDQRPLTTPIGRSNHSAPEPVDEVGDRSQRQVGDHGGRVGRADGSERGDDKLPRGRRADGHRRVRTCRSRD